MTDALRDDEAGALQIGPTDHGMVRFIIQTRDGRIELDFEPDEAADIADEVLASAERARQAAASPSPTAKRRPRRS